MGGQANPAAAMGCMKDLTNHHTLLSFVNTITEYMLTDACIFCKAAGIRPRPMLLKRCEAAASVR